MCSVCSPIHFLCNNTQIFKTFIGVWDGLGIGLAWCVLWRTFVGMNLPLLPTTAPDATGPLSPAERTYALDLLRHTQEALRQALIGLSPAQQQFVPAPNRWSVAQNAEHIVLVETGILAKVKYNLALPEDPAKRETLRLTDVDVIKSVRSRQAGIMAPDPFLPTGRYADVGEAMEAVDRLRQEAIAYVETETGNFRTHYFNHFVFGTLDAYQAVLLLVSHGERHRKQIEEVKASAGYPA